MPHPPLVLSEPHGAESYNFETMEALARSPLENIVDSHLGVLRHKLLHDLFAFIETNKRQSDSVCSDVCSDQKLYGNSENHLWDSVSSGHNMSGLSDTSLAQEKLHSDIFQAIVKSNGKRYGKHQRTSLSYEDGRIRDSEEASLGGESSVRSRSTRRGVSFKWGEATLWPVWDMDDSDLFPEFHKFSRNRWLGSGPKLSRDEEVVRTGDTVVSDTFCQSLIIRPSSLKRTTWDILSVLCISYDMLLIPMVVFDLSNVKALKVLSLAIATFWSADLFFTFFVGFHTSGIIDMRPKQIAKRYFKTWFLLDLLVVASDWFLVLEDSIDSRVGELIGVVRLSKIIRVARVFRALRFLRLWRAMHLVSDLSEFLRSDNLIQFIGIINFMLVILVINHYIACGWYALAEYYPDGIMHTWLGDLRSGSNYERASLFEYASSLHWSFTQFTPASMEVHPRNTSERVYAIIVLLSGLLVFSSFVSGITSAMTRVRENNQEKNRQAENIRRYITDNKVSLDLGRRIHSYMKSRSLMNRARVVEDDIDAFKTLPLPILKDLHAEVFLPILGRHPFFHQFLHIDKVGLVEICHVAVSEIAAAKGQHIFSCAQKAHHMTFCSDGFLKYCFEPDGLNTYYEDITADDYIAEAALWVRWLYKGSLEAASNCVLIELRVEAFHSIASQAQSFTSCVAYARAFAEKVLSATTDLLTPTSSPAYRSPSSVGFNSKRSSHLSDLPYNEDVLRDIARRAFEKQFEEMQSRSHTQNRRPSAIGNQLGYIFDSFLKKSLSSAFAPSSPGRSNVKRTSISIP